ncbi:CoA binding domain protein [Calidithermus terrae]|uniref:CoA binding domain protein n=1 Tax=Calidithermus terrae TaxID=1408545 RepID=A0A399EF02_9DEIN|nr:CoA-binding protein [Calidithermus terrae]RIH82113.1 CoA binding domain protein [Calidithermus terrae]
MNLEPFLREARTVAVLGAHPDPYRPAHFVPAYLQRAGYTVLPVNPQFAGQELFGQTVLAGLEQLTVPVDILDVFRRSEALMEHLEAVLALRPKLVWLQSGIRNRDFAARLEQAGIAVVQDRCLMTVHRALVR